jgi:hypothetical protein
MYRRRRRPCRRRGRRSSSLPNDACAPLGRESRGPGSRPVMQPGRCRSGRPWASTRRSTPTTPPWRRRPRRTADRSPTPAGACGDAARTGAARARRRRSRARPWPPPSPSATRTPRLRSSRLPLSSLAGRDARLRPCDSPAASARVQIHATGTHYPSWRRAARPGICHRGRRTRAAGRSLAGPRRRRAQYRSSAEDPRVAQRRAEAAARGGGCDLQREALQETDGVAALARRRRRPCAPKRSGKGTCDGSR